MRHITPSEVSTKELFQCLTSCIGPRPIALVSTLSSKQVRNLAPFSFFNVFSINPPIVGFSPTRRNDGSLKDTYHNLVDSEECTIQIVTYDIVEQVNIASMDVNSEVDEFIKSGLTPVPSQKVSPPRVKESPFQMECRLTQMIPLGTEMGAGNLALCEVIRIHIAKSLYEGDHINPDAIDLVGRLGEGHYSRASGDSVFALERPKKHQFFRL